MDRNNKAYVKPQEPEGIIRKARDALEIEADITSMKKYKEDKEDADENPIYVMPTREKEGK